MNQRVREFEIPTFETGQKVTIKYRTGKYLNSTKKFTGKVIFNNSRLIVLQNKSGMKECFSFADLHCQDIEVLKN